MAFIIIITSVADHHSNKLIKSLSEFIEPSHEPEHP